MKKNLPKPEYETLIFTFRGVKVMVDYDLSMLYNVPTKRLKEQVKRNNHRFPSDFMFILTELEKSELVAKCDRLANLKHSSVLPIASCSLPMPYALCPMPYALCSMLYALCSMPL